MCVPRIQKNSAVFTLCFYRKNHTDSLNFKNEWVAGSYWLRGSTYYTSFWKWMQLLPVLLRVGNFSHFKKKKMSLDFWGSNSRNAFVPCLWIYWPFIFLRFQHYNLIISQYYSGLNLYFDLNYTLSDTHLKQIFQDLCVFFIIMLKKTLTSVLSLS